MVAGAAVLRTFAEEVDGFEVTVGALALMEEEVTGAALVRVEILEDALITMLEDALIIMLEDALIDTLDDIAGAATRTKVDDSSTCCPP